ncbi:hypothetical protein L3Q82_015640, partial [Scortum barcoo]
MFLCPESLPAYAMVNGGDFSRLTRKHGVTVGTGSPCSVEEVPLAVGELIGHGSVKISCSDQQRCCSVCGAGEPAGADRRQFFMILNNWNEEFNCRFHVRVDDFDYVLFATSALMKCFGSGEEGHVVKACPKRAGPVALRRGWDQEDEAGAVEVVEHEAVWTSVPLTRRSKRQIVATGVTGQTDLETSIVDLEHMSESTGNQGYFEILKTEKMALANLLDTKVQGELVWSCVQNVTEMDAPSSFFFEMEKKHGQSKYIHSLLSDTGQELTEPGQIRGRAMSFYSSLFKSDYEENEELFEEICSGLPQSMQGRKAPGIDGLTVEFYKAFWDILAGDLKKSPTLLPKKGNLQDIKNWRPVSLLFMDYKILLDVFGSTVPGLIGALYSTVTVCLKQLVDAAGPVLTDAQAVSSVLGVRSVRLVQRGLELWRQRLSEKERTIL